MLSSEKIALASKAEVVGKIAAVEAIDLDGDNGHMNIDIQTADGSRDVLVKAKCYDDNTWNLIDDIHRSGKLAGFDGGFYSYAEDGAERATYFVIENIRTVEALKPQISIDIAGAVSSIVLTKHGALVTLGDEKNKESNRVPREVDIELYSGGGERIENFYSGPDKQPVVIQTKAELIPLSVHVEEKEWLKGGGYVGLFSQSWRKMNRNCFLCPDSRFNLI